MATLIRDVRIFDGQTMQAGNRSVLVEGGRIAAIGETADALDNAGAETVVEGKGRTLMPGMVEAHAHLTWAS